MGDTEQPGGLQIVHYLSDVRLDHGGVTRAVLDWCAALASRGSQITLITFDARDVPGPWLDGTDGLPRVIVVPPPGRMGLRLSQAAMQTIEPIIAAADALHLHAPWLPGNSQLAFVATKHQTPYVLSTHGMLDDWCMRQRPVKKRLYLRLLGRKILDNAAAVHCTADEELRQARKWFPGAPAVVLPYVFDITAFAQLPGPALAAHHYGFDRFAGRKILFLSRVDRKKGLDILISALAKLPSRPMPAILVIAGPELDAAYANELREQIKQSGLVDRCVFLGSVTGAMKLSLFEACDLLVLPTQQENFGLALFESLACRTPVITTRGVDVWRDIEAAGGVVVDRDPRAIAGAITTLLESSDLKERGQRGRDWVMTHLDESWVVREYEQLYRRISNRL